MRLIERALRGPHHEAVRRRIFRQLIESLVYEGVVIPRQAARRAARHRRGRGHLRGHAARRGGRGRDHPQLPRIGTVLAGAVRDRDTPLVAAVVAMTDLVILAVLFSPLFARHPIDEPIVAPYAGPGGPAPFGGDQLGRDMLSRLLAGGAEPLLVASVIAITITALAALLGAISALRHMSVAGPVHRGDRNVLILLPVVLSWPGGGTLTLIIAAVLVGCRTRCGW
jgi:hypothetical protein